MPLNKSELIEIIKNSIIGSRNCTMEQELIYKLENNIPISFEPIIVFLRGEIKIKNFKLENHMTPKRFISSQIYIRDRMIATLKKIHELQVQREYGSIFK